MKSKPQTQQGETNPSLLIHKSHPTLEHGPLIEQIRVSTRHPLRASKYNFNHRTKSYAHLTRWKTLRGASSAPALTRPNLSQSGRRDSTDGHAPRQLASWILLGVPGAPSPSRETAQPQTSSLRLTPLPRPVRYSYYALSKDSWPVAPHHRYSSTSFPAMVLILFLQLPPPPRSMPSARRAEASSTPTFPLSSPAHLTHRRVPTPPRLLTSTGRCISPMATSSRTSRSTTSETDTL